MPRGNAPSPCFFNLSVAKWQEIALLGVTPLVRLKRKTAKQRLRRALVATNQWLRQEQNARRLPELWQTIARKMRGHFNYFGVTDNSRALSQFEGEVHKLGFKWLNRRSQRRSFT